ncbi:cysteine synthase A [Deferribacter desulfuricans SSM1]|uniref:Cysteine synthase n=2 Tax=Deferribacter TaxID=53572 RepID=D3PAU5_DEFDS|nr:cysteine synthase A [Deferribacter desulfuricans]BAI79718.1 cysteine synthase A [Deferribacter desulfuricans SSM1]
MKFFESNFQSIGNTPTVELKNINKNLNGKLYAKLENRNPSFSVKDRIGYSMIMDALFNKKLKEEMTIIEPTSGNTGIALAMMGASLGFKVMLAMPESMSIERRAIMQMYGAELLLTPAEKGMKGAIDAANELLKNEPDKFFMPSQFDNPANPKIHEATTGPEIYYALNGKIDYFVAGVGTGGTLSGTSRFLKRVTFNKIKSIAVEPANNPAISYFLNKKDFTPAPHKIQGIGAGFIPKNLDLSIVDDVITIEDEEAIDFARRLFKEEGIMAGISSGANFAAAYKIAQKKENKDLSIVFIVCDTGERYLSTDLFQKI